VKQRSKPASFEVVRPPDRLLSFLQFAKDGRHYYSNDRLIDQATFERQLRGEFQ
jgi:hypothetical protein